MSNRLPTERQRRLSDVRKPLGSFVKTELWYMWVVVFFAACDGDTSHTVRWTFADHRSCADANVTTIVVREGARELGRASCVEGEVALVDRAADAQAVVVEAQSHAGTALYRARLREGDDEVTLRFVGGAD